MTTAAEQWNKTQWHGNRNDQPYIHGHGRKISVEIYIHHCCGKYITVKEGQIGCLFFLLRDFFWAPLVMGFLDITGATSWKTQRPEDIYNVRRKNRWPEEEEDRISAEELPSQISEKGPGQNYWKIMGTTWWVNNGSPQHWDNSNKWWLRRRRWCINTQQRG